MKSKSFIPLVITTLCLFLSLAVQAGRFDRESYVESVITVLRIHADAIRNLTAHEMKYSDNLVRHAVALKRTFGLVGPMDWHAAESADWHVKRGDTSEDMDVEQFEKLGKNSEKALKGLVLAAHDNMEEDDREALHEALDRMTNSCDACHAYLPRAAAPDVWGTLKRK